MNDPFFEERDKICHLRLTEIGTSFFPFCLFLSFLPRIKYGVNSSRNPYFFSNNCSWIPVFTGMTTSIVEEDSNF
jgi:hypothetical protein